MNRKELRAKLDQFVAAQSDDDKDSAFQTSQERAKDVVRDLKVFLGLEPNLQAQIDEHVAAIAELRDRMSK